jgi:FkbM family methyltransferase
MSDHPQWGTHSPKGIAALALGIAGSNRFSRSAKKKMLQHFGSRDGIVDIEHDGLRFRCHLADNATERNIVISGDRHNRPKLRELMRYLPDEGSFVDIGANCGLFTLSAAAKVGPRGRVVAIEPGSEMARRLRFNIAANNFTSITVFQTAVGDHTGSTTLHLVPNQFGKSSLLPQENNVPEMVPVTTLRSVLELARVKDIDALKIDVEGYEDRVLIPFIKDAPKELWPRAVLLETKWSKRWNEDCVGHYLYCGYRTGWHSKGDVLLVKDGR